MSTAPKVSVIIPTYNRSDLLRNAVASVQGQTFGGWELVVVDDGSTDDTKAVVAALAAKDPRIRYAYQPNAGQGAARNTGIAMTRGTYLAFLDSDDAYLARNLETKLAVLEADRGVLIVNGTSWVVDFATGRFADCASYAPTNWLVRREFLERGGMFRPEQRSVEDFAIRVRAIGAQDDPAIERTVAEPLTVYFNHASQVTSSPQAHPEIFSRRLETVLRDLDPAKPRTFSRFAPDVYSRLANFYALEGRLDDARAYFKKSLDVRFTAIAGVLRVATYAGRGPYRAFESALRALQHGIAWPLRLMRAERNYPASREAAEELVEALRRRQGQPAGA
ncbi:MAG TPA: glycosyltransferase [Candidatus Paceibacterota bacterium]|nr:glycosyltransferase [Candidatus Paceibacterota bacterium]